MATNANGKQSKVDSAMETVCNTLVGYVIAFVVWHFVAVAWHMNVTLSDNFWITNIFTVASLLRQYILRRIFNGRTVWEEIKLLWKRWFRKPKWTINPDAIDRIGEDGTIYIKKLTPRSVPNSVEIRRILGEPGQTFEGRAGYSDRIRGAEGGIVGWEEGASLEAARVPLAGETVVKAKLPRKEGRAKKVVDTVGEAYKAGRTAYLHRKTISDNPHNMTSPEGQEWTRGMRDMKAVADQYPEATRCHASRDGECDWNLCPQIRDMESHMTGRHCPLDRHDDEE